MGRWPGYPLYVTASLARFAQVVSSSLLRAALSLSAKTATESAPCHSYPYRGALSSFCALILAHLR